MSTTIHDELMARAIKVVPNGMYGHESAALLPSITPQFFKKAKGTYLWDYAGKKYVDLMSAYGPNLFGYSHDEIDAAYIAQMKEIDVATGPSSVLIDLAERFTAQVSHADWAMFCKNGTDATSISLMCARAHRGKRKVLFAAGAYHGAAPWCTPMPAGTVADDRAHFIYYQYNDVESLKSAVAEAGDDFAGIFATPHRHEVVEDQAEPLQAYAQAARDLCDKHDALLIIDDVRAGFRIDRDCSWNKIDVQPDISAWGKAIANGHSISAVVGSDRAREAAGKIFVTGSFWFGGAAMAASLKTLDIIRDTDYLERTVTMGDNLREGLNSICSSAGLNISQTGPSQMPLIMFNTDHGTRDLRLTYAISEGMMKAGVHFHPVHNMFVNAAMTDADIGQILDCAEKVVKSLPNMSEYHANPMAMEVLGAAMAAAAE